MPNQQQSAFSSRKYLRHFSPVEVYPKMQLLLLIFAGIAALQGIGAWPLSTAGGCQDSCEYSHVCFPEGQTWTDSSVPGCVQFQCIKTVNDANNNTAYAIGQLGCPQMLPPADGTPYINYAGDESQPYPYCCPQIIIVQP
ncbi:Uracil phosphoribosyltransferase [Frankliniella fusca]|uniref:Uracil phosphoribosyltransferase n=1 Tax=Frankliniella fusca TaxID=407009 RepID=A0AAE1HTG0_9NEOP|nr:Uracil phosphoribosyltransferase [Frankliniella fusca]